MLRLNSILYVKRLPPSVFASSSVARRSLSTTNETSLEEIQRLYQLQRAHEFEVARSTVQERRDKLQLLHDVVLQKRQDIRDAIKMDKGNHDSETDLTEIYAVTHEIKHVKSHLGKWMKPQRVSTPLALLGTSSWMHREPKGVCMIMSVSLLCALPQVKSSV